ncbi:MAG: PEP-CTERM sorting domain-containing protein [Verrucomicrobiia bacterium]
MLKGRLAYGWIYVLALATAATIWPGGDVHAVATNVAVFSIDVVLGTDTVETADGTVVFAESDLAVTTVIPLDLAQAIASDPVVPPAIQASIGSLVGTTDYPFLIAAGSPPAELLDHTGNVGTFSNDVFTIVSNDLTSVSLLGEVLKSESITPVASDSYQFDGINPITSQQLAGFIDVYYYTECLQESVPEPATWGLVVAGAAALMVAAARSRRRKAVVVVAGRRTF